MDTDETKHVKGLLDGFFRWVIRQPNCAEVEAAIDRVEGVLKGRDDGLLLGREQVQAARRSALWLAALMSGNGFDELAILFEEIVRGMEYV